MYIDKRLEPTKWLVASIVKECPIELHKSPKTLFYKLSFTRFNITETLNSIFPTLKGQIKSKFSTFVKV